MSFLVVVRPFETWDLNFVSIIYEFSVLVTFMTSTLFLLNYNEAEGVGICKNVFITYLF